VGLVFCRNVPDANNVIAQGGQSGVRVDENVEIRDFGICVLAPHDILNMVLAERKLGRWQATLRRAIKRTTAELGLAHGLPPPGTQLRGVHTSFSASTTGSGSSRQNKDADFAVA
jgi:hypothetical protein